MRKFFLLLAVILMVISCTNTKVPVEEIPDHISSNPSGEGSQLEIAMVRGDGHTNEGSNLRMVSIFPPLPIPCWMPIQGQLLVKVLCCIRDWMNRESRSSGLCSKSTRLGTGTNSGPTTSILTMKNTRLPVSLPWFTTPQSTLRIRRKNM